MREKPPYIANPESSTIAFTPFEFGIIDGRFASACLTHGDGDSFGWTSGGGEYKYRISRVSRGFAKDDGSAVSCWEFSQTNEDGLTETAYLNLPQLEILDSLGNQAIPRMINDISNAAIDISWEMDELRKGTKGVFAEDRYGHQLFIPRIDT